MTDQRPDIEAERKDFERDAIAHGMSARRLSTDEYVSPSTAFRLSGWLARARIAAEREREMAEACRDLLSIVADAITHGMPITPAVADARNKAVAALGTREDGG